ncbi:MAG: diacylglycerol kinase family protein [Anaerolineae bacterium]|nr:diacylglycerol kinase family protein [Anaerolineae bacterium]
MNSIKAFFRSRAVSFRNAFSGCAYVLKTQKNAWIHSCATITVIVVGLWLKITPIEWGLIALAVGFVWTAEFFNTAMEVLVNLASPQYHPLAKLSKDISAAAVLVAAATSVIIGFFVLGFPLWAKVQAIYEQAINIP